MSQIKYIEKPKLRKDIDALKLITFEVKGDKQRAIYHFKKKNGEKYYRKSKWVFING